MITDWESYRKCPVCGVELGKPCRVLSGSRVDSTYRVVATDEPRDRPHTTRELRDAAARAGGSHA